MPIKTYNVRFDADGDVISTTDVTDPSDSPREKVVAVKAKTVAEAIVAAKRLYTFAK